MLLDSWEITIRLTEPTAGRLGPSVPGSSVLLLARTSLAGRWLCAPRGGAVVGRRSPPGGAGRLPVWLLLLFRLGVVLQPSVAERHFPCTALLCGSLLPFLLHVDFCAFGFSPRGSGFPSCLRFVPDPRRLIPAPFRLRIFPARFHVFCTPDLDSTDRCPAKTGTAPRTGSNRYFVFVGRNTGQPGLVNLVTLI